MSTVRTALVAGLARVSRGNTKILTAAAAIFVLLSCSSPEVSAPSPVGLWVWHEAWQSAPDEIVKEFGPQWNAPGALIRFCPDGKFRMAMGVLYRRTGSITLGSSDGLTIYDGEWHTSESGLQVRYHLTDAEIRFDGYERARAKQLADQPTISGKKLLFTYQQPQDDRRFRMSFEAASSLPDKTASRFVECGPPHD